MRDSDGNIIPAGLLKYDKANKISFVNMPQVLILIIYGTNHAADCIADLARC